MAKIHEIISLLEELDIEIPTKTCVCPNCGYEMEAPMGIPCSNYDCPKCGTPMTRKVSNQEPEQPTEESEESKKDEAKVIKAKLIFNGSDAPTFDLIDEQGNPIFSALNKVDAIAKLLQLKSNPTAEDAVLCAMEDGECEVEVEVEG